MQSRGPDDAENRRSHVRYIAIERPDKFGRWVAIISQVIAALSLLVLAGGIWFAIDQAKEVRESIDASTYNTITTQLLEINKIFVEHPELQRYINDKVDVKKGDPNYDRAYAIGTLQLNFFDNYIALELHLVSENYDLNAWHKYIADTFSTSPIMCQILNESKDEYGEELGQIAQQSCAATASSGVKLKSTGGHP
jgi:hypothetical protein